MSGFITSYVRDGGTAGRGNLWAGVKPAALNQVVKVLLADDQTSALPFDKVVVEVSGETMDGKPLQESFKIKISE